MQAITEGNRALSKKDLGLMQRAEQSTLAIRKSLVNPKKYSGARRLRAVMAGLTLTALVTPAIPARADASSSTTSPNTGKCGFVLGFEAIDNLIPTQVGNCIDDEGHNPANGDALQHTEGGLLVWRKSDGWTAFTNGYKSWVNGPYGLQERLNTQRFKWEANNESVTQARQDPDANTLVPAPVDSTPAVGGGSVEQSQLAAQEIQQAVHVNFANIDPEKYLVEDQINSGVHNHQLQVIASSAGKFTAPDGTTRINGQIRALVSDSTGGLDLEIDIDGKSFGQPTSSLNSEELVDIPIGGTIGYYVIDMRPGLSALQPHGQSQVELPVTWDEVAETNTNVGAEAAFKGLFQTGDNGDAIEVEIGSKDANGNQLNPPNRDTPIAIIDLDTYIPE